MSPVEVESVSWLRFLFASSVVIGLLALLAWGLRQVSSRGWLRPRAQGGRLSLVSSLMLDGRRRLVIAKCDEKEFLLLLGPNNDILLSQASSSPSPQPDKDHP